MEISILLLFLLLGLVLGGTLGWAFAKMSIRASAVPKADLDKNYVLKAIFDNRQEELERARQDAATRELRLQETLQDLAAAEQNFFHLEEKLRSQKADLENLNLELQTKFENLATRLLEEKSEKFTRQNREQLAEILNPLREKIDGFEKKVNDVYQSESQQRSALQGEIKALFDLNQKIGREAQNLAAALKGDNKKQGNWGEMILERVLERSGLQRGQEYELQYADTNTNGRRIQPDVVIHLPEGKHLIIDSKVSLSAYEKFVNADDEKERESQLKWHVASLRGHVKGLAEKEYQQALSLNPPDFVLLFVPVESSFSTAVQADPDIFQFAWEQKIVIVSPSTLLATLRTVASIWKQERHTRHAVEIARQAGALYDKFVGFVEEMRKIGASIEQMDKAYHDAMNKLQFGKDNLIRKAERIKSLGIKATKSLPSEMVENEMEEQE